MIDPHEKKFAEDLKSTDRVVSLDPTFVAAQIKSAQQAKSRGQKVLLGSGLACLMLAVVGIIASQIDIGSKESINRSLTSVEEVTGYENENDQYGLSAKKLVESKKDFEQQIIESKRKIKAFKKRLKELDLIRKRQRRAILRAELSTELELGLLAEYQF